MLEKSTEEKKKQKILQNMENEENFLNLMLEWDKILDSSDESELDFEVLFTLKLNLDQYLLLASKVLIPGFIKNKDKIYKSMPLMAFFLSYQSWLKVYVFV